MRQALVLATMLGLACGGQSQRDRLSGSSGHGTAEGGGLANGSSGAGGSSAGGSGGEGADARAGTSYVPEDSSVPAAGDGRLEGGSFEGNLGSGWDFCFSKYPGATRMHATGSSDGDAWLAFDSKKSCSDSFACATEGDDAQVGFWLSTPLPPAEPVHLYFDAIELSPASASGTLHIDALQSGCMSAAPLATIRLRDLGLTSNWTTRCVSFTPSTAVGAFGLFVAGDAFQLGLDTFRFGPECGTD
jgi:hypothetical protein